MIKKIFGYLTIIFGFLITLCSSIIAMTGISMNLTGKEHQSLVVLIFTLLILLCFVFLGLKIIKIGRMKLASIGNINENIYQAVEMPLIKRLFWILTIAVGFLIVFSIVCFILISLYILITDKQARYTIGISNFFNFALIFFPSIFLGFYLMRIGRMKLTIQGETATVVRQNVKNKAALRHLLSLMGGLLGLMAIFWSLGTSLFFIGAGGRFSLDVEGIKALIFYLGIILGGVGGGVVCIIKSIHFWKRTAGHVSSIPEGTEPRNQ